MGMIELDFISVVIGYVVGVFLTWSLTFTLFGCEECNNKHEDKAEHYDLGSSPYGWNYPYDRDRIM